MAVYPDSVTVIFPHNHTSWGQYYYDAPEDALRVTTHQLQVPESNELLTYTFHNATHSAVTAMLGWEKWRIPFMVSAGVTGLTLASIRQQLRNEPAFNWLGLVQGAEYSLTHNTDNVEEALTWENRAVSEQFAGEANFRTLSAQAQVLARLGRTASADSAMQKALPVGKVLEIHVYGRQLPAQKQAAKALEVFKLNAKLHPDVWPVHTGLARAYSAVGDYKASLTHAELALEQAPDEVNRKSLQDMVAKLKEGKDVN